MVGMGSRERSQNTMYVVCMTSQHPYIHSCVSVLYHQYTTQWYTHLVSNVDARVEELADRGDELTDDDVRLRVGRCIHQSGASSLWFL